MVSNKDKSLNFNMFKGESGVIHYLDKIQAGRGHTFRTETSLEDVEVLYDGGH
jgi:hypothetical protein